MNISHPAVEDKADVGWFLMGFLTRLSFVGQSSEEDCPNWSCGCSPRKGLHPPGPPRGPWVGYCGAVAGAVAAQDPVGVCLQALQGGGVETARFYWSGCVLRADFPCMRQDDQQVLTQLLFRWLFWRKDGKINICGAFGIERRWVIIN